MRRAVRNSKPIAFHSFIGALKGEKGDSGRDGAKGKFEICKPEANSNVYVVNRVAHGSLSDSVFGCII